MIEIRLHGRGGQGVKKSAQILARMFFLMGYKTQDFAVYGAERKGAPIIAFVRIDKKRINTRGYIFEPDNIIILDDSIDLKKDIEGLKKGGSIFLNSKDNNKLKNAIIFDVTDVALKYTGRSIANIVMLGLVSKKLGFDFKYLKKAIEIEFENKPNIISNNLKGAKEVFDNA